MRCGRADLSDAFLIGGDLTRSENLERDQPIPRSPPIRVGFNLSYQSPRWDFFLEGNHHFGVTDVALSPSPELPTEAYTLLNAGMSYRPGKSPEDTQNLDSVEQFAEYGSP